MQKGKAVYVSEFDVPLKGHDIEDGGQAVIVHADDHAATGDDGCFFVRLQSWDERAADRSLPAGTHPIMQSIFGKRVRVTVEVLEPDLNPAGWDDNAIREAMAATKEAKEAE